MAAEFKAGNSLEQLGAAAEQLGSFGRAAEAIAAIDESRLNGLDTAVPHPARKRTKVSGLDSADGEEKKPKKTRQTQSCDACRARKVKCDRPPPGTNTGGIDDLPTKDVCTHCRQLGMACTFEYKPKKRGPPNMYLKRMQALNQAGDGADGAHRNNHDGTARPGPGPGTIANQNEQLRNSLGAPQRLNQGITRGRDVVDDWTPTLARTLAAHKQRSEVDTATNAGAEPLSLSFLSRKSPSSLRYPGDGFQAQPGAPTEDARYQDQRDSFGGASSAAPPNPIDAVIPRSVLYQVIEVYFDYVYCLIPVLHKPSFMADVQARREERPGEEEWTALVLSVVEATLITMPRSFVRLSKCDIKELFNRANSHVKHFLNQDFTVLTVTRPIIIYFHALSLHLMGQVYATDFIVGASYKLSIRLQLHDEASYRSLNPIERELRKRIFWLQYGADKTISAIDGAPSVWHEQDCGEVTLPSPVDDEYITEEGYLDQPDDQTPTLAGFYYISKLFRLLGQITDKRRIDRLRPPSGVLLQMRISEVEQIFHQVMTLMDNAPEALKLDLSSMGTPGTRMDLIDQHWDTQASADIRQMVLDPSTAHREVIKDGILVQQANIYVTQQMVRYIVLQYREELGVLLDLEIGAGNGEDPHGSNSSRRTSASHRPIFTDDDKDQIASDLLMILSKIPLEVIAVNTVSLVIKIRYIASTLLDGMQSQSGGGGEGEPRANERIARVQGYLWDFLRILSEIESLYILEEDE